MANSNDRASLISIGAVSANSGVPVATIRNWERRHGFPEAERLPSGHRRYALGVVAQLKQVRRLLESGARPVDAINAIQAKGLKSVEATGPIADEPVAEVVEDLIHFSLRLDNESVDRLLERAWRARGPLAFMSQLVGPLLVEVGTRWARGEIGVATEHFISERLRDFLSMRWRAANGDAQAAKVVCACLPGERHVIGLHLAAVAASLAGVHVVFLGADTPIRDILSAVDRVGAKAVAVSVAGGASTDLLAHQLKVVRRGLPRHVSLWIGGTGAASAVLPERSEYLHSLERLQTLANRLVEGRTTL